MNWTTEQIPPQENRVVIVTGANSGIGFEITKALVAKGATVIMACRNLDKARQAAASLQKTVPNAKLDIIQLDLADLASVKQFSETFNNKYSSLDLLINNAGIMIPPFGKTKDGFELQFGSNHLGHFALTRLLLERLKTTPKARVINVSSSAHRLGKGAIDFENLNADKGYSAMNAYSQSKLANVLFTLELNQYFQKHKIDATANAAEPGLTATNLLEGIPRFVIGLFAQPAAMGALPILFAATANEVKANDYFSPNGFIQLKGYPRKFALSAASRDEEVAKRLWKVSEELTGVHF